MKLEEIQEMSTVMAYEFSKCYSMWKCLGYFLLFWRLVWDMYFVLIPVDYWVTGTYNVVNIENIEQYFALLPYLHRTYEI